MKKQLFRWGKLIIIIYCLLGCAFYYLQHKIFLHPVVIPADSSFHFTQPFKEVNIDLDADTRFNMVQFTVPDSVRKGIVLYFHGNKENINRYAPYAYWFTKNGYEVWMPDYPGFGKSTGELREDILYEEAMAFYKMARARYEPSQIVLYGKSLGTGIAAQLASVRDCRYLLLETPYYSLISLAGRYGGWIFPLNRLMHLKMPTHEYLPKVTAPITIFHGTDDGVIPYRNAKRLEKFLKPGDRFITIPDGSHNDLGNFPVVLRTIDSLLSIDHGQ